MMTLGLIMHIGEDWTYQYGNLIVRLVFISDGTHMYESAYKAYGRKISCYSVLEVVLSIRI